MPRQQQQQAQQERPATCPPPSPAAHQRRPQSQPKNQQGAIAIMLALMLLGILGFCGLAIDVSQLSNRKIELQGLANAVALSAARELDGTSTGVNNALDKAASTASAWKSQYTSQSIAWTNSAIEFGSETNGPWLSASAAQAAPGKLLFARVDTSKLADLHGTVNLTLSRIFTGAVSSVTLAASAVAGRMTINVTPIAICALSNVRATKRTNPGPPAYDELVEFGFRRGVSYDLMQLNPGGTTPLNFVVDPFSPPGTAGAAGNTATSLIGPMVCNGTMAMSHVTGGTITVSSPFPLSSLYNQLNSRFGQYVGGACTPESAPPDANVKAYTYSTPAWMNTLPTSQAASASTDSGKLWTVADPVPTPAGTTAAMYGPLWAYARAVPFSSYVTGANEPAAGYSTFATSAWSTLYKPGMPTAGASYPASTTPYKPTSGTYFQAPAIAFPPGVANRRVLNVPLLSCPVTAGTATPATVAGIGKFFMTVPATATTLVAEFAGVAVEDTLGGPVELVR